MEGQADIYGTTVAEGVMQARIDIYKDTGVWDWSGWRGNVRRSAGGPEMVCGAWRDLTFGLVQRANKAVKASGATSYFEFASVGRGSSVFEPLLYGADAQTSSKHQWVVAMKRGPKGVWQEYRNLDPWPSGGKRLLGESDPTGLYRYRYVRDLTAHTAPNNLKFREIRVILKEQSDRRLKAEGHIP
jgi:hypothetical protein